MELKYEFCYDSNWWNGRNYTCKVTEATITQPGTVVDFKVDHKRGRTHNDVEALVFKGFVTVVEFIPNDIAGHLPQLINLITANCGLKEIQQIWMVLRT